MTQQELRLSVACGSVRLAVDAEGRVVIGTHYGDRGVYAIYRKDEIVGCRNLAQRQAPLVTVPVKHCGKRPERFVVERGRKSDEEHRHQAGNIHYQPKCST